MKNILFFGLVILILETSGVIKTRFKSMKCTVLNKTVYTNDFCYVKAYSRNYATLNWGETRRYPVGPPLIVIFYDNSWSSSFLSITFFIIFQIKGVFKYRYGNIFREIMHVEFDLCFLSGKAENPITKTFAAILKKSVPGLFQGCPFKEVLNRF